MMKLKSAIRKLGICLGAAVMTAAVAMGSLFSVDASAEKPTANTFDGSTWENRSGAMMSPEDGVLTVEKDDAAYNTTPVGTYDETSKTYTVSVEVSFNMETFNGNHTQIFISPAIVDFDTTISGKFGTASSTLLGTRAYYKGSATDLTNYNNNTMSLRVSDYGNYRTDVSFENVMHDGSTKHVFTWIITETAVTMQFDGTDLCASGTTPYELLKSEGVNWTLADFMDNGTPKAYFGTYNTAWTPLKIYNAGETPVVETEETVEFEGNQTRNWKGSYLYPSADGTLNTSLYSIQNVAQDYDQENNTFRVSVKMSFEQASYNSGQVVVWVSPTAITDWDTDVNKGLGNSGKLLAARMYYQNQGKYDANSLLIRICDYKNYSTADYLTVKHDGTSTHTITWSFSASGVTMQFDGVDLGSAYKMQKASDGTLWTISDFMDSEGNAQAYFGMMNGGTFGNAYLYNVKKSECKTVTFKADNGTENTEKEVYAGTPVSAIENPTKTSDDPSFVYVFDAWYNGETKYDFAANVTEDITLTARYTQEPVNYTATVVNPDETTAEVVFNSTNLAEKLAEITVMLPANDAEYTYAWASALPEVLPYENVEYTITRTPVEYTATVVKADGTNAEVTFNVENRETKLAEIAAMKPADDAEYTYAWTVALPETLPLETVNYTFTKTAVEYTATVVDVDGNKTEVKFNVENRETKLLEIAAMKPANNDTYNYYWAVELPAELPLENVTFTVVKAGETYTATVIAVDGTETEFEFSVSNRAEKLVAIAALKPADTAEYTYTWEGGLPNELPLQNITYKVVKTAVEYTATVVKADGTSAEVTFNVENRATKLAEIVAMLPANDAEYTYAWTVALPETLALENATFTVVKTAVEYTATVVKADGTSAEVTFNVENRETKLAEIAAMLPANDAEYTYAWTVALPETLALENATFTVVKTAVEYTAMVVKADGTEVEVVYTVENRAQKLEEIAAMRPKNTEEYTYGWSTALPVELPLENGRTYTVTKTAVEPETPDNSEDIEDSSDEKTGLLNFSCSGSMIGMGAMTAILAAVSVVLFKKKED